MSDEKGREKEREKEREKSQGWGRSNSLFWGVLLIGTGVLLLLSMSGAVTFSLGALISAFFRLWPLWLIAAGLNILFGQTGRLGELFGALLGLAIIAILFGVALTTPGTELQTETLRIPMPEGETRPDIAIKFDDYPGSVRPVTGDYLLEAEIEHHGGLQIEHEPSAVQIDATGQDIGGDIFDLDFNLFDQAISPDEAKWDIRLLETARIGDLTLTVDDGMHQFDLRGMNIQQLFVKGDNPNITLELSELVRDVHIRQDGGEINIRLPDISTAAVRIDVEKDDGRFDVDHPNLELISGNRREGTWQTDNYNDTRIELKVYIDIEVDDTDITIE